MTKILPLLPKHKARNLLPGAGGGQDKSIGREKAEAVVPGRPLRKAVNPGEAVASYNGRQTYSFIQPHLNTRPGMMGTNASHSRSVQPRQAAPRAPNTPRSPRTKVQGVV